MPRGAAAAPPVSASRKPLVVSRAVAGGQDGDEIAWYDAEGRRRTAVFADDRYNGGYIRRFTYELAPVGPCRSPLVHLSSDDVGSIVVESRAIAPIAVQRVSHVEQRRANARAHPATAHKTSSVELVDDAPLATAQPLSLGGSPASARAPGG